jgi:excisionase family DNA binding protein
VEQAQFSTQDNSIKGEFLTVAETAAYLRLSKAQLYKMVTRKQIPHIRLGQKRVVIRRTELEKWLETQSIVSSH